MSHLLLFISTIILLTINRNQVQSEYVVERLFTNYYNKISVLVIYKKLLKLCH